MSMPYCVVVRGPLGVGKSTVSSALAEAIDADHISIDRLLEEHGLEEWDEDRISLTSFLRANVLAVAEARTSLAAGRNVVIEGCFYWREQLDDLVRRVTAPTFIFTLKAPLSVCVSRDRMRPLPREGVGPKAGDQLGSDAAKAVFWLVAQVEAGLAIDATGSVDSTVTSIIKELSSPTANA